MDWSLQLKLLLDELTSEITVKFPDQIVSVVLFGSATTGEWIKGKSDIDCIVVIKDKRQKKIIDEFLHKTLFELDSKYKLELVNTCSVYKKVQDRTLNTIIKTEKFAMFGRPFYVIAEDQIDFANAKIRDDLKMFVGIHVIASLNLFFHRIKSTGRVLYGKDITKQFPTNTPVIEKIKASLNAVLLLWMSVVTLPVEPKMAFSHAVKANFWACDDVLFALEKPLADSSTEVRQIKEIFSQNQIDIKHLDESLQYKKAKKISKITKRFAFLYIIRTTRFVLSLYRLTIQKMLSL